jgi:multidrug efflux pump
MFSRFFIDRPIFASVLSIVITLAGGLAVFTLPLAQYPRVTPPTVQVTCTYPGASATDVAEAVAAPIEQEVNGVEGMMYMSSQCTNDGQYNLTVTFYQGTDLDMAQVLVQNRVALAVPKLPDVIKATGVTTIKRSPDIIMGFAIQSVNGRYDQLYLSNYALRRIRDELGRVPGVSDVFLFGQMDYSMRVWLNPDALASRGLGPADVVKAIREHNQPVAAGQMGMPPVPAGQMTQLTLDTEGRLSEARQFERIVVKATSDGRKVRLRDVARVELGSKGEDVSTRMDGMDTAFCAIFQRPDANALDTANRVIEKMEDLKRDFPTGVDYDIGFDTTPYTRESINEVFKTLRDAIILVAVVVLIFLQNWRSAVIPLVAVPVAIIGTFAVMKLMGFSLNNLTLFGLVLAIGIVVDDAIVVVEAVEHHIEHGLSPRDATIKAMQQVSGPVIAVGLVLSAVFVPCAFMGGLTGLFFRQFALTISVSTLLSAFNSLTLSPALTALLMRPKEMKELSPPLPKLGIIAGGAAAAYFYGTRHLEGRFEGAPEWGVAVGLLVAGALVGWLVGRPLNAVLRLFFSAFNATFARAIRVYTWSVGIALRVRLGILAVYLGLLVATYFLFARTPRGFVPSQDMGYLMGSVQLPDAASLERTTEVMNEVTRLAKEEEGVWHAAAISGMSFALSANGSNFGSMFINLNPYSERRDPNLHSEKIASRLRAKFATIEGAQVALFSPPPVRGVGRAGGFAFVVEDRGDMGPQKLQERLDAMTLKGNTMPKVDKDGNPIPSLFGLFSVFRANVPQIKIEPDKRECMSKGVDPYDFAIAMQAYQGSLYVNDLNLFGRTYQVIVQADQDYRDEVGDIQRLKVRNRSGGMVPIGSIAKVEEQNGPLVLPRYNMYPAAIINGAAGPGTSSGQANDLMEQLAHELLPESMAYEWTDMSYLEKTAGSTAMSIFSLAVLMVFLVLAAQYESWGLPLAVILVVPMCLLSAVVGVNIAAMDINIFTQVGFVVLVGLASKNAILIVEFAKSRREVGAPVREATLEACRLRLRPIIMTSLAFILGAVPLVTSEGAGAEMRQALGVAVFGGMIGVTMFGLFLTPIFFYMVDSASHNRFFSLPAVQFAGDMLLGFLLVGRRGFLIRGMVKAREGLKTLRGIPAVKRMTARLTIRNWTPPDKNGDKPNQLNGNGNANGITLKPKDLTPRDNDPKADAAH